MKTTDMTEIFGPVLHAYSRADALKAGDLVDLREKFSDLVEESGFTTPVACTRAVYAGCIALSEAARAAGNDEKGRAWDLLHMLRVGIRLRSADERRRSPDRVLFQLYVIKNSPKPELTTLLAHFGPGDTAEPALTIMLPEEQ